MPTPPEPVPSAGERTVDKIKWIYTQAIIINIMKNARTTSDVNKIVEQNEMIVSLFNSFGDRED